MSQAEVRPRLVLAVCCLSLFIVGVDNTIVNVALPSIRDDLHASVSGLQWTVDAYTLVIASLLMFSGSTADRLGRRRVFQIGLVTFTVASLLCSIAPGLGWLVAFRALQAVGGSMLNPVAMSIITNTFTDPKERAKAIGVWGAVIGISLALGPVLGGALVDTVGWRGIFWVNVPVGVAAVILAQAYVPESRAPHARRPDPVGQLLVAVFLVTLVGGLIEGPSFGWGSPFIVGLFLLSVAAIAGLVSHELHRTEPLIDVRFFRSAPFSGATASAVCAFSALGGFLFLNTIYLQDVRGYTPFVAGLCTLPLAAVTIVAAPLSGRMVASRGPRLPLLLAGIAIAGSGLAFLDLSPQTSLAHLLIVYVVFGTGFGLVNAPITNSAVSGMPRDQAGVAAAVASTSRQVGQSLGVAVLGSLVVAAVSGPIKTGFSPASHVGWVVVAVLGLAIAGLGVATTTPWAARTAEGTRTRLVPAPA